MSYLQLLGTTAPELILVITAFIVLAVDLLVMRGEEIANRFLVGGLFAIVGCAGAITWLLAINLPSPMAETGEASRFLHSMFTDDSLTRLIKVALIGLTIGTLMISLPSRFTEHVGEYLSLILMATVGMMLLVSSMDLLMIFIALELTSLSLYILTAFNKQNIKSVEAALKYFLFGGMAASFTLFGLSLVYGLSGSTNLQEIGAHLVNGADSNQPLLWMALLMVLVGFAFKIAVAPFHLWAPDAYEGAPTPSAALIASGSKLAGFFILTKVVMIGFSHANGSGAWHHFVKGWIPILAILAALSILVGNLAAIAQKNVRRLLAYSAIAQAGYALLGILANDREGVSAVIFYMLTYGMTVVGAFGVVTVVEANRGDAKISDFAGLSRKAPWLSACMMVFMLSLAGIPPLAGFFGKFYLFKAALSGSSDLGSLWLVIFAIAMSAVSLYYYLQVLKQIYVAPPIEESKVQIPPLTGTVIIVLAIGVIVFGCFPDLLLRLLIPVVQNFGI